MHGKGVRDKFETGAVRLGSHWTLNHRAENGNFTLPKSGQVGSYFFSVELNRANFFFYEVDFFFLEVYTDQNFEPQVPTGMKAKRLVWDRTNPYAMTDLNGRGAIIPPPPHSLG